MSGERNKFELVYSYIIRFFTKNISNDCLEIFANLVKLGNGGFELSIEFKSTENAIINEQSLINTFTIHGVEQNFEEMSLENLHFKILLKWLKNSTSVNFTNGKIILKLESAFSIQENTKPFAYIPIVNILPKEQIRTYTTRWANDIVEKIPEPPNPKLDIINQNDSKAKELVTKKLEELKKITNSENNSKGTPKVKEQEKVIGSLFDPEGNQYDAKEIKQEDEKNKSPIISNSFT